MWVISLSACCTIDTVCVFYYTQLFKIMVEFAVKRLLNCFWDIFISISSFSEAHLNVCTDLFRKCSWVLWLHWKCASLFFAPAGAGFSFSHVRQVRNLLVLSLLQWTSVNIQILSSSTTSLRWIDLSFDLVDNRFRLNWMDHRHQTTILKMWKSTFSPKDCHQRDLFLLKLQCKCSVIASTTLLGFLIRWNKA